MWKIYFSHTGFVSVRTCTNLLCAKTCAEMRIIIVMSETDFRKQLLLNEFRTLSKGKSKEELVPLIFARKPSNQVSSSQGRTVKWYISRLFLMVIRRSDIYCISCVIITVWLLHVNYCIQVDYIYWQTDDIRGRKAGTDKTSNTRKLIGIF